MKYLCFVACVILLSKAAVSASIDELGVVAMTSNDDDFEFSSEVESFDDFTTESATGIASTTLDLINETTTEVSMDNSINDSDTVRDFEFVVRDDATSVYCTLSKMSITMTLRYRKKNKSTGKVKIKIPQTARVNGNCGHEKSYMLLTWPSAETMISGDPKINNITFAFVNDGNYFSVDRISIAIYVDDFNFPDAAENQILNESTKSGLKLFAASVGNGFYTCKLKTMLTTGSVDLMITDVSLIAFNKDNDLFSRSEQNCIMNPRLKVNIGVIVGGVFIATSVIAIIGIYTWRRKNINSMNPNDAL